MLLSVMTYFGTSLSSCKKDENKEQTDDKKSNQPVDSLLIGSWTVNKVTLGGADVTSSYLSAQQNFDIVFNVNKTCTINRGGANVPGNYDLNKDKTQLTITYYNNDIERYELQKVTESELNMKMTSGPDNYTFIFKRK